MLRILLRLIYHASICLAPTFCKIHTYGPHTGINTEYMMRHCAPLKLALQLLRVVQ
jgi:hypothetical protein